MKPSDRRAHQANSAAQTRKNSDEKRDVAFRKQRDAERVANAEKTERLKKLRLAKEAADAAAKAVAAAAKASATAAKVGAAAAKAGAATPRATE